MSKLPAVQMRDGSLVCPRCQAVDQIREVDSAIRWNELHVDEQGDVISVGGGDAHFETDHYECRACKGVVGFPFEITDWK
ncbi:hypothetical protein [Amycolatopsis sp. DSM 110486]|uniref:hypothetical protein n=1 Tax=Amycolatopsis sp. DSM 110486 TaxID=2865832 RepID=UPI001C6A1FF5|nr:hypothetical protein [Amycolatopsis sp. DSM 110486]QYN17483.1 hypothetical protein K1T34_32375 [Amycolatopsis sp. DSM 110486]